MKLKLSNEQRLSNLEDLSLKHEKLIKKAKKVIYKAIKTIRIGK